MGGKKTKYTETKKRGKNGRGGKKGKKDAEMSPPPRRVLANKGGRPSLPAAPAAAAAPRRGCPGGAPRAAPIGSSGPPFA